MGKTKSSFICGFFVAVSTLLFHSFCSAAPNTKVIRQDIEKFVTSGSFSGGSQNAQGFSLTDIKRVLSPSRLSERMIFEVADRNGKVYSGKPGYFHVQLKQNPSRMVIDFSQMGKSRVENHHLLRLYKDSKLVKSAHVIVDKEDSSTNLSLTFKEHVKFRVYSLAPKNSAPKVVVDFAKVQ